MDGRVEVFEHHSHPAGLEGHLVDRARLHGRTWAEEILRGVRQDTLQDLVDLDEYGALEVNVALLGVDVEADAVSDRHDGAPGMPVVRGAGHGPVAQLPGIDPPGSVGELFPGRRGMGDAGRFEEAL